MDGLEIQLFGTPQILVNGHTVQLGSHKAMALLAYLAVEVRRESRDSLAALFWPDQDATRGRAYLRQTFWTINRATGADRFDSSPDSVVLRPEYRLDVHTFSTKVAECLEHGHPAEETCPRCIAPLEAAAALYHGDFMAGLTLRDSPEFDEWQSYQTEALRQRYASVLDLLARQYSRAETWEKALQVARRRLALDALHEPAHRQVMHIFAASGQRSAALNQYGILREVLRNELDADPEPETETLYAAIRSGEFSPPRKKAAAPAPPAQAAPDLLDFLSGDDQPEATRPVLFVGREHELSVLERHLQAALAGNGRMVFISGEAGSGKTSLLMEFARRAEADHPDLICLRGDCNAYFGMGDPYLPFRELLSTLGGDLENKQASGEISREQARRIWRLLPDTVDTIRTDGPDLIDVLIPGSLLSQTVAAAGNRMVQRNYEQAAFRSRGMAGELAQIQIFDALTRVLSALSTRQPLALLLDDLQWADNASISLLFYLARRIASSKIVIVGAYRPSDVALGRPGQMDGQATPHALRPVIHELKRYYGDISIDLGEADLFDGRAFIQALLDSQPNRLGESFREALLQHTQGHPLFTIELLRDLQERGALVSNEQGEWMEAGALDWETLPVRVEAVIEQRFSRLEPAHLDFLSMASIEGEEFTVQVAARLQGIDERQALTLLSHHLEKQHRLVSERGETQVASRRLTRYRFGHVLFQQYLYNRLGQGERRLFHGEVARALEDLYGGQTDDITTQLAHHYSQAGKPEKAAVYLRRAGDQARRRIAMVEATDFYRSALEAWPPEDRTGRAETHYRLGECLWVTGRIREARLSFEQALAIYEATGRREDAGAMERLIGRMYWEVGKRERSLEHYHRALGILESIPESIELARAVSAISQMHMLASQFDEAIAWGERALALAERLGAEDVSLHALNNLGSAYLYLSDRERGQTMLLDSRDRALALGLPHDVCRAYSNLGEGLAALCCYSQARQIFNELEAYATQIHATPFYHSASIRLVELDWMLGRWEQAYQRARPMLADMMSPRGLLQSPWVVWGCTTIGMLLIDAGQPTAARQTLEKWRAQARTSNELQTTAPYLGALFRAYAALGLEAETREILKEFVDWVEKSPYFDRNNLMPLLYACLWTADRGGSQPDEVQACLMQIEKANRQLRSTETAACLAEGTGNWRYRQGDWAQARGLLQEALKGWEELERPYDQVRTLFGLSEVDRQLGDRGAARGARRRALAIAERLKSDLTEVELQATFWDSPLIRALREAG